VPCRHPFRPSEEWHIAAVSCPSMSGRGLVIQVQGRNREADFHDAVKTFWLLFKLKSRLKDLQSLFNEVEKPPFPDSSSRIPWETWVWRWMIAYWGWRGENTSSSLTPCWIYCVSAGVSNGQKALVSKLQAKGRWEKLERDVSSCHEHREATGLPEGLTAALVRAEVGGEPLSCFTPVDFCSLIKWEMVSIWLRN